MSGRKALGIVLIVIAIIAAICLIISGIYADYIMNKNYMSYWSLSDKSSTLASKQVYISQFVDQIDSHREQFAEYDALILKTPDNNCDRNINAVKTLRDRLNNISQMDENSFAYQTAMQQITAQEQGEAAELIDNIQGCWYLKSYPWLWSWILFIIASSIIIIGFVGFLFITWESFI